ncbi:MAG: phospholipase domain-containing protein, partial [Chitinophagales bacterium]
FKNTPSNFKRLTKEEVTRINKNPHSSPYMPVQEKGIRTSCALPYELYADGKLAADKKSFEISLRAGNKVFGDLAAGSPFHVYTPGKYQQEDVRAWSYAVGAGDALKDYWNLNHFENDNYHLRVYGPNGFFREFMGNENDPLVDIIGIYEMPGRRPTGKFSLQFNNRSKKVQEISVTDNAYKTNPRTLSVRATGSSKEMQRITLDTGKSHGWYDFTIKIKGYSLFEMRYAGRIETGSPGKTDPAMGRVI